MARLPQLSLRDLFWLVLVAAVGCAWWVERKHDSAQIYKLQQEIAYLRGY